MATEDHDAKMGTGATRSGSSVWGGDLSGSSDRDATPQRRPEPMDGDPTPASELELQRPPTQPARVTETSVADLAYTLVIGLVGKLYRWAQAFRVDPDLAWDAWTRSLAASIRPIRRRLMPRRRRQDRSIDQTEKIDDTFDQARAKDWEKFRKGGVSSSYLQKIDD